jgi:hypothetical protein
MEETLVSDASILGIGKGFKERINQFGIFSADQVERDLLLGIPNLEEKRFHHLVKSFCT